MKDRNIAVRIPNFGAKADAFGGIDQTLLGVPRNSLDIIRELAPFIDVDHRKLPEINDGRPFNHLEKNRQPAQALVTPERAPALTEKR